MSPAFLVGDARVEPSLNLITTNGVITHLRPKVMDLLVFLAQHPRDVVSKQQLLDAVWGAEFVSESALTTAIAELRHALGDRGSDGAVVETVPKRGYRLVAPVTHGEKAVPAECVAVAPAANRAAADPMAHAVVPGVSPASAGPPGAVALESLGPGIERLPGPPNGEAMLLASPPVSGHASSPDTLPIVSVTFLDAASRPRTWLRTFARVVVPTVLVTASAAVIAAFILWPSDPAAPVRSMLDVGPAQELNSGGLRVVVMPRGGSRTSLAWTRDGRSLVYVGRKDGRQQLYVRDLARDEAHSLSGTADAQVPVVSPDGTWLAFWAEEEIRRLPLAGGPAQRILAGVTFPPAGMAIGVTGRVVFSAGDPAGAPLAEAIWEIKSDSTVARVTSREHAVEAHVLPQLIDHDRVLLFTVKRQSTWGHEQVMAQRLPTGERRVLLDDAADARYLPTGHLLFMRRGLLMAVPFDAGSLRITGEPIGLVQGVAQALVSGNQLDATGAGQFAVSATGALAYVTDDSRWPTSVLTAIDRAGHASPLGLEPHGFGAMVAASPDGYRLAVESATLTDAGLWIGDLARGTFTRLAPWGEPGFPVWSPDGEWIVFTTLRASGFEVARQRADDTRPAETVLPGLWYPSSWSPDGRFLALIKGEGRIWILPMGSSPPKPVRLTDADDDQQSPAFSPDGRWLAYASGRTGRYEVYVRPFPGPGPAMVIPNGAGTNPRWNRTRPELFFLQTVPGHGNRVRMMVVSFERERLGTPRQLFEFDNTELPARCAPTPCYAVAPDGERFYVLQQVVWQLGPPVTHVELVTNWRQEVESRVPGARTGWFD